MTYPSASTATKSLASELARAVQGGATQRAAGEARGLSNQSGSALPRVLRARHVRQGALLSRPCHYPRHQDDARGWWHVGGDSGRGWILGSGHFSSPPSCERGSGVSGNSSESLNRS